MNIITRGFRGRRGDSGRQLPPGQYLTHDFPVLSAGPTPRIPLDAWEFTVTTEQGDRQRWSWTDLMALATESITARHPLRDALVQTGHRLARCLSRHAAQQCRDRGRLRPGPQLRRLHDKPAAGDLLDGKAWIAYEYNGEDLAPEHGGPARLLVPHLYLWKSAKWIRGIDLMLQDSPGFWEQLGYHDYGDPWREQRYQGD
jgi:DMSO/TMAO reductase YedYZ molybdopterin-dependent catalytic subunit